MAMHSFFEVRIRYEKMMGNGQNKKVNEPYLVDALSFTESEARITKEMTPFIPVRRRKPTRMSWFKLPICVTR